jgi:hypothetical protein
MPLKGQPELPTPNHYPQAPTQQHYPPSPSQQHYVPQAPFQPQYHPAQPAARTKKALYCFHCNENLPACSDAQLDLNRLRQEHSVPCNGQCVKYRNPNDGHSSYFQ